MFDKVFDWSNGKIEIVGKRVKQYNALDSFKSQIIMEDIFNTIPKNFRKIYMFEVNFDEALKKFNNDVDQMRIKMRDCLKDLVEVIG